MIRKEAQRIQALWHKSACSQGEGGQGYAPQLAALPCRHKTMLLSTRMWGSKEIHTGV